RNNTSGLTTLDLDYNSRNLVSVKTNVRGQTTTYEYDDSGRLISFTNPDRTVSFTYDQNGNLLTAADNTGATQREYDELNRIKKYTDTQGNIIEYAYDANGNLITLTYPGGRQVQYQYDAADRLVKVTDWAGRITSYEYDPNGRLVNTTHPNGAETTRAYDDAGRQTQQKDVDTNNSVISQYDYTYDASGNFTEEKNSSENVTFTMDDAALTYAADNRLATYNGQAAVYDADGNMTYGPMAGKMENFTYDARGRLTGAGNTRYTYDAGNNRVQASDGVHQTNYIVNPNAPLSQTLVKTDEQNNQTFYVYGLGLIGQESPGGAYRTYHFDSRGSTIALTDEIGEVTDRFLYAPYGEQIYRSGNTATPFLFSGRYGVMTDASDLYYMRVRYYNPVAKRFLSPDTLTGQVTNPQSQNLYTYCNGNPVRYVDPMGHLGEIPSDDPIGEANATLQNLKDIWDFVKPTGEDANAIVTMPSVGAGEYVIGKIGKIEKLVEKAFKGAGKIVNKAGKAYPEIIDPRTEKNILFPKGKLDKIPADQRVEWNKETRAEYIREWYNSGYQTPEGGWENYDIHHIKPREYGGDNTFENLVPIRRDLHQDEFNEFWRDY
ncbi:MAG: RHS repeat-associated core domain-containing protein, partial [Eubacteriales bacterium]